jgi:hypothetical protein
MDLDGNMGEEELSQEALTAQYLHLRKANCSWQD